MRVGLLFSGGVESASLAKWILTETDWELRLHHVALHNSEKRASAEGRAVRALAARLNTIRSFGLTFSSVSLGGGKVTPMDYAILYPIAHAVASHSGCQHITRGWCQEDNWVRRRKLDGSWAVDPVRDNARWHRQLRVLEGYVDDVTDYCLWLPPHEWTKAEHYSYLGSWAQLTHSCRTPVDGRACGRCFSCACRTAAQAGTSAIPALAHAHP